MTPNRWLIRSGQKTGFVQLLLVSWSDYIVSARFVKARRLSARHRKTRSAAAPDVVGGGELRMKTAIVPGGFGRWPCPRPTQKLSLFIHLPCPEGQKPRFLWFWSQIARFQPFPNVLACHQNDFLTSFFNFLMSENRILTSCHRNLASCRHFYGIHAEIVLHQSVAS